MGVMRIATAAVFVGMWIAQHTVACAADAPPGAASCSGCHPANRWVDTAVPRLAGRNRADLVAAMQAFKSGQLAATVMDRIAKGFSDDEIKAIAVWYGAQKD
jgi:sulfide dehydrogenase cytochrome subunit